jgi:hypothetical protein
VNAADLTRALDRVLPDGAGATVTPGGQPGEYVAAVPLDGAQRLGVLAPDGGGLAGLHLSRALGCRVHITLWRGLGPDHGFQVELVIREHAAARDEVFAQLARAGYGKDQADAVMADAEQFPTRWAYTEDRRRAVVFVMPGGTWRVEDTEAAEAAIAASRPRRGAMLRVRPRPEG